MLNIARQLKQIVATPKEPRRSGIPKTLAWCVHCRVHLTKSGNAENSCGSNQKQRRDLLGPVASDDYFTLAIAYNVSQTSRDYTDRLKNDAAIG